MAVSSSPADLSAALVLEPVAASRLAGHPAGRLVLLAIGAVLLMTRHKGAIQPAWSR